MSYAQPISGITSAGVQVDIAVDAAGNVQTATASTAPGGSAATPEYVTSGGYSSSVAITRPSNTTAYGAGDAIGIADAGTPANAGSAIIEFTNVGQAGKAVLLTSCDLRVDLTAVPSGMTSFRLHLYSSAPDAILDNAVWDLVANDRAKYRGYIDFGVIGDLGSTLWVQADSINRHITLVTTSLFGVLTTNGAYTPASGTVYTPRIRTVAL